MVDSVEVPLEVGEPEADQLRYAMAFILGYFNRHTTSAERINQLGALLEREERRAWSDEQS